MNCKAIDDILKSLEELENQGYLSVTAGHQIHDLKFELRYMRMHVKWDTWFYSHVLGSIKTCIENVEMHLLQPTRKGSMTANLLEETLPSLLQSIPLKQWKKEQSEICSSYFEDQWYGRTFAYEDVKIDDLVLEWIDPLLENLKHLICSNGHNFLVVPKEQIEALMEKLKSLKSFLEITGTELEEVMKNVTPKQGLLHKTSEDLLTHIKMLIENALYLSYYAWANRHQERMEKLFFALLVKINHVEPEIRMIYIQLLKASKAANPGTHGIDLQALATVDSLLDNLQKLLKGQNLGFNMPLDLHQIEFLHQELSFLKYFLMDPHLKQYIETHPHSFNSLLIQVEATAREGALLTHAICVGKIKDHTADEMNLLQSDLPKIVKLLKNEIRQMYLRIPKSSPTSFPRTPRLGFLDFFLQKLDELLKHRTDSIAYVKNEIQILQSELGFLSSLVSDTTKKSEEHENIVTRIVDVAYEAEHIIDLISANNLPNWYYVLWLSNVIEKIKMLRAESIEVCSKKTCEISDVKKASTHNPPRAYTLEAEEEVVGFKDEAEKIIDRLTRGPEQLDIVSIVGMPGLGKTTLAKKVYEDPLIKSHFHVRSWYCISQVYNKRDLLLSILGKVTELTEKILKNNDEDLAEKILKMNDEDLEEVLCKSLKGRRYLIVLDDIWNIEPWLDIRISFPDDSKGSRILFTTRNREVSLQANPTGPPHDLRLFSVEESWELLQHKVFKQRSCPTELHKIGEQIAKNCKGLPLSVVVTAGVLATLEESEDQWKQVSDSVKCTDALELSYKHLADHLKPCFLYLGAFPEDKEIPTLKLVRLWMAEGLIQKTKSESLENVAEGYLMDLIARSLVLSAQTKSNGGVKSCRVHDLLHEFAMNKAKSENFPLISKEIRYPQQTSLYGWMPSDPYVRSVLFFPTERAESFFYDLHPVDLSVLPYLMKLLRVLDLEHVPLSRNRFPTEIELLVHLRYLAVRGEMDRVPASVGNLWRLETLIVQGTSGEVRLPETLLEMSHLKHVYVNERATFELPDSFEPEKSSESEGIENLSTPSFRRGDGITEKVIRRLRNLRKLKCIFFESWDYFRCRNRFPVLDLLSKLESLHVTYCGTVKVPCEFSFPSNLKKLTLSKFRLPWREISMIGRLPQLEVLKLVFRAFEGRRWEVNDDEFLQLKVLKLESLNIAEWYALPGAFPCLEKLVLQNCKHLQEIHSCFGESDTLKMIGVHWCSHAANEAVCKIEEEQRELVSDGLRVLIEPPDWDSSSHMLMSSWPSEFDLIQF